MKRIFAILTAAALLQTGAQAACALRLGTEAALVDDDGSVICDRGKYEDIVRLSDERFAAGTDGKYGLMDAQGRMLTEQRYTDIHLSGNRFLAERDGLSGLLSPQGEEIGEFVYTALTATGDGAYWALKDYVQPGNPQEVYILRADGTERATGQLVYMMSEVSDSGLLRVLFASDGLYGYLDADGVSAFKGQFETAGDFTGGIAAVTLGGKYGAINTAGEMCVPAEYDYLQISEAGFLLAGQGFERVLVLDTNGRKIAEIDGEGLSARLVGGGFAISDASRTRIYSAVGTELAAYSAAASVYPGVDGQLIVSDGAWGESCVSLFGSEKTFQNLYPLCDTEDCAHYAYMEFDTARYMNDLLGEIQYSWDPESVRCGLTDAEGEVLLPAEYRSIEQVASGRFLVRTDTAWQLIDESGRVYWEAEAAAEIGDAAYSEDEEGATTDSSGAATP